MSSTNLIKTKFKGTKYKSVADASKKIGIPGHVILMRLKRGESIKDALFKGKLSPRGIKIIVEGTEYRSLNDARKDLNPNEDLKTISWRYRQGWPIKEVLGIKVHISHNHKRIRFRGKNYKTYSALAREYNVNPTLFSKRLNQKNHKHNFTIEEALGIKKVRKSGFPIEYTIEGKKFLSRKAAAKHYGISEEIIRRRLKKGWSVEQAFGLAKRRNYHPGKIGIIYIIRNKINKKTYIGATLGSLANRWVWHLEKSRQARTIPKGSLREAIKEFGGKNFTKKIIKRCRDLHELSENERYFIKKYNSKFPKGYNLTTGGIGFGNLGRKVKIGESNFNNLREAAKYYKIHPGTFVTRLNAGWSLEEAAGLKKNNKIPPNFRQIKINGQTFKTVRDAAKFCKISESNAYSRLSKGWSIKRTFTIKKIESAKKIKVNGKNFKSIRQAAKYYNIPPSTAASRLANGLSPIKAFKI